MESCSMVSLEDVSRMGSETDFDCGEVETVNKKEKVSAKALKKHVCPFTGCHSAFNRPWKLSRHINVHTKERPFKCDYPGCSKDYMNKSHLDRHKCVSHTVNKPKPVLIQCPYPECTKVFMNKWSVKRHCNTHKNKELYKCAQCEASFKKSKQLKNHLFIHMGVKPFVCDICNDSFEIQREFKRHKRKHKLYICEEGCKQQFNTWNALRNHVKLFHFSFFICDSCGKKFKNKWTLTEHVFSHLPENERDVFVCPYNNCERFYFHQRNLEHHLKSFHQDINFKCDNCGQSFVKRMALKAHERQEHMGLEKPKKHPLKVNLPRKPRCDKGQHKKSMAAMLSGIILPYHIDKSLAQNNITNDVLESIQSVKNTLLREDNV